MSDMIALRAHRQGGPEVLIVERVPVPIPADGEVLVAVHAAAITFDELTWPETWTRDGVDRTPIVPSHEFSGVVAAVASGATGFAKGDAVFGLVQFDRDGAAAQYVTVPAADLSSTRVQPNSTPRTRAMTWSSTPSAGRRRSPARRDCRHLRAEGRTRSVRERQGSASPTGQDRAHRARLTNGGNDVRPGRRGRSSASARTRRSCAAWRSAIPTPASPPAASTSRAIRSRTTSCSSRTAGPAGT